MRWTVRVTNGSGATVRSQSGSGASVTYTWRGTDGRGRRVPDGRYAITVSLLDPAGNAAKRTALVAVDTTPPRIAPAATPRAFSPERRPPARHDGPVLDLAGARERQRAAVQGVEAHPHLEGIGRRRLEGDLERHPCRRVEGRRRDVHAQGRRAGRGRQPARRVDALTLDRTVKGLAWGGDLSPQDGDALKSTSRIAWRLARDAKTTAPDHGRVRPGRADGLERPGPGRRRARLDVERASRRRLVRAPGPYLATLRVKSPFGTLEYSRWVWAAAFTLTPSRTVVKAGQTLVVRFRSVEPLSTSPGSPSASPAATPVTVTARKLDDGSWKASFAVRSGDGGTATIRVVATDRSGGRNATKTTVRVK